MIAYVKDPETGRVAELGISEEESYTAEGLVAAALMQLAPDRDPEGHTLERGKKTVSGKQAVKPKDGEKFGLVKA